MLQKVIALTVFVGAIPFLFGARVCADEISAAEEQEVVKKEELPPEVKKIIEVKKQEEFQMAYQCEGELYLLRGYGIQSSGGYSIQVEYVRENEEELHIKTRLLGPESREEQKDTISCPSIVVKVENRNKKIVFD